MQVAELDLWFDVVETGNAVHFVFHNDSSIPSVLTALYVELTDFSAAALRGGGIVSPQPMGVVFSLGARPRKPPGSIAKFGGVWSAYLLTADADAPKPFNGIGPTESLAIGFTLIGVDLDQLLAELGEPPAFRVAAHVQAVCPHDSQTDASLWVLNEAFDATGPTPVPLPAGAWLGLAGGVGLLRRGRR